MKTDLLPDMRRIVVSDLPSLTMRCRFDMEIFGYCHVMKSEVIDLLSLTRQTTKPEAEEAARKTIEDICEDCEWDFEAGVLEFTLTPRKLTKGGEYIATLKKMPTKVELKREIAKQQGRSKKKDLD